MENSITWIAIICGIMAFAAPSLAAAMNIVRSLRTPAGDHLEVRVGSEHYVIDVASLDRENLGKIEAATRAVQEARRQAA